jgi:hypothetical protein
MNTLSTSWEIQVIWVKYFFDAQDKMLGTGTICQPFCNVNLQQDA